MPNAESTVSIITAREIFKSLWPFITYLNVKKKKTKWLQSGRFDVECPICIRVVRFGVGRIFIMKSPKQTQTMQKKSCKI